MERNDAKRIGLVDELGGLNDAIAAAVKKAQLKNYKIETLPQQEDFIKQLTKELGGAQERMLTEKLGQSYTYFNYVNNLVNIKGVQARMPYDVVLY